MDDALIPEIPFTARGKELPPPPDRARAELQMDLDSAREEAAHLRLAQGQTEATLRSSRVTEAAALRAAATAIERAARLETVLGLARKWALPSRTAGDSVALIQAVRECDLAEGEAAVAREEAS